MADFFDDGNLRNTEPYHYERNRQRLNNSPRMAQPNTNQPNQKAPTSAWGQTTKDYWGNLFQDYLQRRR